MMNKFHSQFEVRATLESVAEFHWDAHSLKKLTPPPVILQYHIVQPLQEGSVVDFTLWIGPIPVRWVAVHHDIQSLHGFTDSMMRGPFEVWVHTHKFDPVDENRIRITDIIESIPGPHPFWGKISKILWKSLPLLFRYRRWRTRRALETL